MSGTVTKVEWTNPHARLYIDVRDDSGQTANWNFEMASPNILVRNGWKQNTVKVGDRITVSGYLARTGNHMAIAGAVADATASHSSNRTRISHADGGEHATRPVPHRVCRCRVAGRFRRRADQRAENTASANARGGSITAKAPSGPTPRKPNGQPDLTGLWLRRAGIVNIEQLLPRERRCPTYRRRSSE
jgi:hypothetical protein